MEIPYKGGTAAELLTLPEKYLGMGGDEFLEITDNRSSSHFRSRKVPEVPGCDVKVGVTVNEGEGIG